jgi:hypothetical protein
MRESARCSFSQLSPSVTLDARVARGRWTADACTDALARVCPASAPSTDDVGPDDALQPGLLSASWAAPNNPLWRGGLPSHAFLLRLFLSLLVGLTCTVDCWRGPAEAGVSAHASNPSPTARGVDRHRTAGRPPPRQGERPAMGNEREQTQTRKVREDKRHQRRDEECTTDADPSPGDTGTQSCRTTINLVVQVTRVHGGCGA